MSSTPSLIVRLDRSGRSGKTVTLVENVPLHPEGKETLLRDLKKKCGAGGALKGGVLEIQGDHRDRIKIELEGRGYSVKKSGG